MMLQSTVALASLLLPFALVAASPPSTSPFPSDRSVYMAACAACHGADGRGMPKSSVAFEEPLPDFTNCSFATREPDGDWLAVSHDGGPARGFARMMPAFGEALSEADLTRALAHVRTLCPDRRWPPGDLNLPRPLFTGKAFPEDEAVFTSTIAAEGDASAASKIIYETRVGPRGQVELIAPFVVKDTGGKGWDGGIGDVGLAYKRVLWFDRGRGSIFSAAGEVFFATGDDGKDIGSGTTRFEPFLAWGQILPRDGFAHLQAGAEIPMDSGRAAREGFVRVAAGRSFTEGMFGRTWSPMVELLANRDLEPGAATHWAVAPQFQVTLNVRQHIMASIGARIPLDDRDARNTEIAFYLLWDWFDGGLTDGW
jgi:mono/diheme cytochrome c family protein